MRFAKQILVLTAMAMVAASLSATPAGAVAPATGCVVTATSGNAQTYTHYTNPDNPCAGSAGHDYNIRNELVRLINATPGSPSWIRGTWYSMDVDQAVVAEALLAAARRGVTVRLTYDRTGRPSTGAAAAALNTLATDYPGSLVKCPASNTEPACISSHGVAHTKLFAFSRTSMPGAATTSTYVVWFGSYNLTSGNDGSHGWNNATTVYGDQDLYDFYKGVLDDMYTRRGITNTTNDYYTSTTGKYIADTSGSQVSSYSSPENDSDLMLNRLSIYDATARPCKARIVESVISGSERPALVDLIASWATKGCDVQVAANHIDSYTFTKFKASGVVMKTNPQIHDKLVLVTMKNTDSNPTRFENRIFTGSQNWDQMSLERSDDLLVRLGQEPVAAGSQPRYDAAAAHFSQLWTSPSSVTCGTAIVDDHC